MKRSAMSMSPLWTLLVAGGYGCAAEINASDATPVDTTQSAVSLSAGEIHPGCPDFLQQCREGNAKGCAKYSERCEVRIGVIGDSLSDEYQGAVSLLPGMTWTEQVQALSRISLGANEDDPSVRGEPRNDGFALNWARFGQAATNPQWSELADHPRVPDALKMDPRLQDIGSFDAQIHGLGAQIAAGSVDVALVWVGHNDLFIRLYIGAEPDFSATLITKIVTAAATLKAYASVDPNKIKAKVAIIGLAGVAASALNPALSEAAADAGIVFIDPFNTAVNAIVTEQATTGSYDVAGLSALAFPGTGPCGFNPATMGPGCATPAYAEPFNHYDGTHPNTLYMGVVGNQIITNVNTAFGFAMQTITEAQLLDTAGL
jgi:hypothetical protein